VSSFASCRFPLFLAAAVDRRPPMTGNADAIGAHRPGRAALPGRRRERRGRRERKQPLPSLLGRAPLSSKFGLVSTPAAAARRRDDRAVRGLACAAGDPHSRSAVLARRARAMVTEEGKSGVPSPFCPMVVGWVVAETLFPLCWLGSFRLVRGGCVERGALLCVLCVTRLTGEPSTRGRRQRCGASSACLPTRLVSGHLAVFRRRGAAAHAP